MAKIESLVDIGSLGNPVTARAAINANSQRIEDAFQNTLSRDGSQPNQMEADIDLNGNYLLNVADANSDGDGVNLRQVQLIVADAFTGADPGLRIDLAAADGTDLVTYTPPSTTTAAPLTDFLDDLDALDLDGLPTATGSASVGFTQAGTGAVLRSVQDKLRDNTTIQDYGGSPGGPSFNNSPAMALAVAANRGEIEFPPGRYYFDDPIVIDQDVIPFVSIKGSGEAATEFVYTGTGDFITITRSLEVSALGDPVGYNVDSISFRSTQDDLATALFLELDDAAPSAGSYEGYRRRVSNCTFMGLNASNHWKEGIRLKNATFSNIENITFRGLGTDGDAIVYEGGRAAVDNSIYNLKAVDANCLIKVTNERQEGLYIDTMVGVSVASGIQWSAIAFGNKPLLRVDGCHLNLTSGGVGFDLDGVNSFQLADATIYLNGATTIAVRMDSDGVFTNEPRFSNVNIYGVSGPAGVGIDFGAGINYAVVGGISMLNLVTGIKIAAGAQNIIVDPTVRISATTPIDNLSTSTTNVFMYRDSTAALHVQQSSDATPVQINIENFSAANVTTKTAGLSARGKDTGGTVKDVGAIRWKSTLSANWGNSAWGLYLNVSNVITELVEVTPTTFSYNGVIRLDARGFFFPPQAAADIASAAHAINTTNKQDGKAIWDTTNNRLMIAAGSAATDGWIPCTMGAAVTPA